MLTYSNEEGKIREINPHLLVEEGCLAQLEKGPGNDM